MLIQRPQMALLMIGNAIHGTDADADGDGWSDEEENLCGSLLNDPVRRRLTLTTMGLRCYG